MAGMVPHARLPLDDRRHAGQRPQIGAEALGTRPSQKPLFDLGPLLARELGFATGAPRGVQRRPPGLFPGLVPPADTLAAGAEHPSHKSQFLPGAEQFGRLQTALF